MLPRIGHRRLDAIHTVLIEREVVAPLREQGKLRTAKLTVSALRRLPLGG